jgi:hypothetical protein
VTDEAMRIRIRARLPGLEAPAEGPLPGYPDIRLLNTTIPTGHQGGGSGPAVVAAAAGVAVGAIGTALILTTRRRPQH